MVVRTYEQEKEYIERLTPTKFRIKKGFVDNMSVEGIFYVNKGLEKLMFDELRNYAHYSNNVGGFLPAVKQIGNVASLPGIVKNSIGLPDVHSGYGFAIGNVLKSNLFSLFFFNTVKPSNFFRREVQRKLAF